MGEKRQLTAEVFIDTGKDFRPEDSLTVPYTCVLGETVALEFDLSGFEHTCGFRFDPLLEDSSMVRLEEIALTCKSSSVIEQEEDYIAQKEALEEKLSGASVLTAVQHYGEDQYPYGFDLHMLGTETVAVDADTWHLTATCDVPNEYGIEAEMTCEALVTGTTGQPTVKDFTVY